MDQGYRNMLWHMGMNKEKCEKCIYWDNMYSQHLARVKEEKECNEPVPCISDPNKELPELTDEEMILSMDMDTDASSE